MTTTQYNGMMADLRDHLRKNRETAKGAQQMGLRVIRRMAIQSALMCRRELRALRRETVTPDRLAA